MTFRKYKVKILPQFKKELYKIFGYGFEADLLNQIIKKLKQLEEMPKY